MKRTSSAVNRALLILLASAAVSLSCSTQRPVSDSQHLPPGWISEYCYRCGAIGEPDPSLKNKIQRRGTAKAAAFDDAKLVAADRFARIRYRLQSDEYVPDFMISRIESEFGSVIDSGIVVKETYDDDDNCEVVVEIREKKLLGRVMGDADSEWPPR